MSPKEITVLIFHNANERESFMCGYEYGDPLRLVYEGHHRLPYRDHAEASLEYAFAENQHGVPGVYPWYQGARSLCGGDIIVLDKRAWAINKSIGFTEIDPVDAGIEEQINELCW